MSSPSPRVVAHRGASEYEPEHTLAAYLAAIDAGADGLECDVRLSADGHLVCVHDRTVDRTSNGSGLVSTLELTDLQGLDWGSWKRLVHGAEESEVPDRVGPGERSRLLTLRRLLGLVVDAGRPVELVVETKHPTRYGGLVERTLVETLDHFGLARPRRGERSRVTVMSFSLLAVRRVRQLAPGLPLVLLMERTPLPYRDGSLPRGVAAAGISVDILRAHPGYVRRAHRQGHEVHVWTVDEPEDVERCLDAGVDVIITNRPQAVLTRLGRARHSGAGAGPSHPSR